MAAVSALGRLVAAGIVTGCLGCGDALVPTGFEGEPVFRFDDFITLGEPGPGVTSPVYALFWQPDGYEADEWQDGVQHPGVGLPFYGFDVVPFLLFDLPPLWMLTETERGGLFGLGTIVLFDDLDGDGRLDPDEPQLGHAEQGILYVPEDLNAARSPTGRPLVAGFHRIEVPTSCVAIVHEDEENEACDAPLGLRCQGVMDPDCGDGFCMSATGSGDRGWCALRNRGECEPENGAARPQIIDGGDGPGEYGVLWLEHCTRHSDCGEDGDRYCDVALGACVSDEGMRLQLGRLVFEGPCLPTEDDVEEWREEWEAGRVDDEGEDEEPEG